jgi:class 3 adenylate cyclase/tetratricopeptide (TPR) repeat protein
VQERKLATVLFADVVGFTSLAERTDPEIVARMVDAAFRQLGGVVADHGGNIDKYMGDSLMAVFGVPIAHDDDAERAVAAGLAMRKLGGDLVFSIGINSGEVMATPVGGAGDSTVIGDTVNVAARLEKAAGPGEVLCGPLTAELVGSRALFRPRQAVILKGKREPLDVWEAVAMRPSEGDQPSDEPPLLGRDDEMSYLRSLWHRVCRDSQPEVALVCGEAGSGKTRLASELARVATADGSVVRATYPAYGSVGGMRVAAEVLRQLGPAQESDVTARVRSLAGSTEASLKGIDPAGLHTEQMWGVVRLLEEKSAEQPIAIVLDDMHRGSETSLDLLSELGGRLSGVRVLLVLVGRSEPSDWLNRFPGATTIRLAPLGPTDAAELVRVFVCDKPLAAEATTFLVDRAGGNPLYLRELVRMARSQGSLIDDGDCYRLGSAAAVPATLQALLSARLDALGQAPKLVFQHAAVLGDGATATQIAELGPPRPESALRLLVDAGLLRPNQTGGYDPADPMLREVAYETLPLNVRGDLHRRAAEVVSRPDERARHLERAASLLSDDAAVTRLAADELARVGEDFFEQSRLADATRLLERAVALGSRRPEALLGLARLQELAGSDDDAVATLSLIPDDASDPSWAVERDHGIARARMFTDPAWARSHLLDVSARWLQLGDRLRAAWAIANAGVASFNLSRMGEAAADLDRALEVFERLGDRAGAVSASSFLSLARPSDKRVPAWLAGALEFADETGDRAKQVSALSALAWHHSLRSLWGGPSDTTDAEQFARRLADGAEEIGAISNAVHGHSLLAIAARFSGRIPQAAAQVEILGDLLRREHHERWLGWAVGFSVAVAQGASQAAPPFPPVQSVDPVAAFAAMVAQAELVFAGRVEEALAHYALVGPLEPQKATAVTDVGAVLAALALVLSGRPDDAAPWAERAARAALVLEARPTGRAAQALIAEINGNTVGLPDRPEAAASVADSLVLRAYAVLGDAEARERLQRAAESLAAPGLLLGL